MYKCVYHCNIYSFHLCSSFAFPASSVHKRSFFNPYGDITKDFVKEGNQIAMRISFLMFFSWANRIYYLTEQSVNSVLHMFPEMAKALEVTGGNPSQTTYLGAYGHMAYKPIKIWGTLPRYRPSLYLGKPAGKLHTLCDKTVSRAGRKGCSGNKHMSISEHYPADFGRRVATVLKRHLKKQ